MLKNMNLGAERVKEVRTQTLWREFEALRMGDSESIDEYLKNSPLLSTN